MFADPALPAALTVVFVVTGVDALVRYARLVARPADPAPEGRAVTLLHLLMSVAMIAMTWGWSGGPATGSGLVQLAVFGVFAAGFTALALTARRGLVTRLFHGAMAAAMVWMVATMPLLMGGGTGGSGGSSGGHAGHAGHEGHGGGGMAAAMPMGPPPSWVVVGTLVLAAGLAAAAVAWVVVLVRPGRTAAVACAAGAHGPAASAPSTSTAPDAGGGVLTVAPVTTASSTATWVLPRPGWCHALMSAGMAAMLLAMR